jgi:hypothetical protein
LGITRASHTGKPITEKPVRTPEEETTMTLYSIRNFTFRDSPHLATRMSPEARRNAHLHALRYYINGLIHIS